MITYWIDMVRKIRRMLLAANMYIEDPEDRIKFKEKIHDYLRDNHPEVLDELYE